MVTLTINRKPQGIFSKSPATPLQDKTNTVHNEKPLRVRNQTPWRHMTKRQRKNRKRINRLVEHWPELFNREKTQPLKVEIPDDLIQDIAIRELAFGAGALRAAVASYVQSPRYYRALMAGGTRYDLKGQPCGEVTPQEQKEAETRLMVLNDRQKPENLVDYTTALIH
ncbi:ProQ/FinO family protein [Escherichia coli]|uniref:ProQ/FINO family protein n=1 Tax=Escherichia coli TaxID=562 RepID=UPI0018E7DA03|nr:ProQ/FinO family protein [Escherichia coli]MBJ1936184.1 ProQ/FinO family protein [Escherichia coli]